MYRIIFPAVFLAIPAAAQQSAPCDWQANAANLAEPWEENTRTFSNGKVRVALLDTVEPAGGPFYLLIISPPYDELGLPQCRVVGWLEDLGFYGLEFGMMEPNYDPSQGLELQMPASLYDNGSGEPQAQILTVTINQASGEIGVRMDPNPE